MINIFRSNLSFLIATLSVINHVYAAPVPPVTPVGSQSYVFIENNIDNEFFIASRYVDPRFTGANVWTKFKTNQDSLGYMGGGGMLISNSYVDYWLENSPIKNPYLGSRCRVGRGNDCPSVGYMIPEYMDEKGSYKSKVTYGEGGGAYPRATFANGAYQFFRTQGVGTSIDIEMNVCSTTENYDPKKGERCKDMARGAWRIFRLQANKVGHIKLEDTKAFSEIWIGTDGAPALANVNEFCEYTVLGKGDENEGIACNMVKYQIDGTMSNFPPGLRLNMVVDSGQIGYMPSSNELKIDGGNGQWKPWNQDSSSNSVSGMMLSGSHYIRVLFTKAFFKKMIANGGSTNGKKDVFTFAFNNSALPQSGFYQFATAMRVDAIPREYGLSIRPKDASVNRKEGKIGKNESNITFNYIVTQSAPRKADVVTAHVLGETVNLNGQNYCLFKSEDARTNVAIPSYLSYTNNSGQNIKNYSGCDASKKMNFTDAVWQAIPWSEDRTGFFFKTDLNLMFPMNDPVSENTLDGIDWSGKVNAEGQVKVEAKWIGVNP